ncbi:hypothetical protein FJV41_17465 [Myxococcus llanfairpwllgwyngyllgogerychwyrndrobwllllantysiliogogogochensis]|uniref:Lipoprotein n=1 Tax=Myxococcus llanfairpwllgwyngyllgogerychwyrndrobwllllantysiliogogogochensis TaxID=2590453 RepID=A0A540X0C8_9BACT|nr:hypothetical protein FJV41_17465 [Myxococcus llanfairpwllgwyngyllgogerychwyrndrobwllllantysiliogogogochensis]
MDCVWRGCVTNYRFSEQLVAVFVGVTLVACSSSRQAAPENATELQRLVLVIREQGDGVVTHAWEPAEGFDLPRQGGRSRLRATPVVSRPRDCDEENRDCVRECMSRPLARGYGHITNGGRKKGGKLEFCQERCDQPLRDCQELERLQPREFAATDDAVDWLKRNRTSVLMGSLVVIAGVAFVVVSMGAGLLVLAPAILMVETPVQADSLMTEASP